MNTSTCQFSQLLDEGQVNSCQSSNNTCRTIVAGPQPLRSEAFPDGLASMSFLDRCRVKSANALYRFIADVAWFCLDHAMVVVMENPRSSLYWRTSFFAPIRKCLKFAAQQACAYGSERPKWTEKLSTAEETAYPMLLAYTMAYAIVQHLMHKGWQSPPSHLTPPDRMSYQYLRAIVGSQPKASTLRHCCPSLIPLSVSQCPCPVPR